MATRFRITESTTIKASLYNSEGKLLTTIYDSGYTRLSQVESALLSKCCNPPRETSFSILNEDQNTYWSNRKN